MITTAALTQTDAREQLDLMRIGMPAHKLYIVPPKERAAHERFTKRLRDRQWGLLLVHGDNGAGKTTYLRHLEDKAQTLGYGVIHVELDQDDIRRNGGAGWLSRIILQELRLPSGMMFRWELENNSSFRDTLHKVIEDNHATFHFWSPVLTSVFSWASQEPDENRRQMAQSWLRGEPQYAADLRTLDVYSTSIRSAHQIQPNQAIHFINALVTQLGAKGLFLTIDEVERAGFNLPPIKARETLSSLRDLVNILVSDTAKPTQLGVVDGVFVCFAVSTTYLGYSGILTVDGVDFRAQAERIGRPKLTLQDVPRLARVLEHSAARIDVGFEAQADLEEVAEMVGDCYKRAETPSVPLPGATELAVEAFDRTGSYIAGDCIQAMIRHLDEITQGP